MPPYNRARHCKSIQDAPKTVASNAVNTNEESLQKNVVSYTQFPTCVARSLGKPGEIGHNFREPGEIGHIFWEPGEIGRNFWEPGEMGHGFAAVSPRTIGA